MQKKRRRAFITNYALHYVQQLNDFIKIFFCIYPEKCLRRHVYKKRYFIVKYVRISE